jgi:hypothetical protein
LDDSQDDSDASDYLDRMPTLKKRIGGLEDEEIDSEQSEDDGLCFWKSNDIDLQST